MSLITDSRNIMPSEFNPLEIIVASQKRLKACEDQITNIRKFMNDHYALELTMLNETVTQLARDFYDFRKKMEEKK